MPKLLEAGKKIRKLIKVYGIESPVELTVAHEGLWLRIPGTRLSLYSDWPGLVSRAMTTPDSAPCYLAGEPMKFLEFESTKAQKSKAKRAAKKA